MLSWRWLTDNQPCNAIMFSEKQTKIKNQTPKNWCSEDINPRATLPPKECCCNYYKNYMFQCNVIIVLARTGTGEWVRRGEATGQWNKKLFCLPGGQFVSIIRILMYTVCLGGVNAAGSAMVMPSRQRTENSFALSSNTDFVLQTFTETFG